MYTSEIKVLKVCHVTNFLSYGSTMFFKIVLYHHFIFYQFTVHDKKTKIDKYVTGNPVDDPKPVLTPYEEKLLQILGESPGMKGIRKRLFDTPIVINT